MTNIKKALWENVKTLEELFDTHDGFYLGSETVEERHFYTEAALDESVFTLWPGEVWWATVVVGEKRELPWHRPEIILTADEKGNFTISVKRRDDTVEVTLDECEFSRETFLDTKKFRALVEELRLDVRDYGPRPYELEERMMSLERTPKNVRSAVEVGVIRAIAEKQVAQDPEATFAYGDGGAFVRARESEDYAKAMEEFDRRAAKGLRDRIARAWKQLGDSIVIEGEKPKKRPGMKTMRM